MIEIIEAELSRVYAQQASASLKAAGLKLAVVINFGGESLTYSQVANTKAWAFLPSHLLKPPKFSG